MNDDLMEIFYEHYKSELKDYNSRTSSHEIALSLEGFTAKCDADARFRKEHVYLFHPSYLKNDERFFQMVDFLGGWPVTAKSVVLQHNDKRSCYFSSEKDIRDGWNTSIFTSDEYYWWKLSDAKKNEFRKEICGTIGQNLLSKSYKL